MYNVSMYKAVATRHKTDTFFSNIVALQNLRARVLFSLWMKITRQLWMAQWSWNILVRQKRWNLNWWWRELELICTHNHRPYIWYGLKIVIVCWMSQNKQTSSSAVKGMGCFMADSGSFVFNLFGYFRYERERKNTPTRFPSSLWRETEHYVYSSFSFIPKTAEQTKQEWMLSLTTIDLKQVFELQRLRASSVCGKCELWSIK